MGIIAETISKNEGISTQERRRSSLLALRACYKNRGNSPRTAALERAYRRFSTMTTTRLGHRFCTKAEEHRRTKGHVHQDLSQHTRDGGNRKCLNRAGSVPHRPNAERCWSLEKYLDYPSEIRKAASMCSKGNSEEFQNKSNKKPLSWMDLLIFSRKSQEKAQRKAFLAGNATYHEKEQ